MKKRLLSALLAVAMLASLLTVAASAETTGTYGDLTYSIENGEVTITGCSDTISGTVVIPDKIEGYPVTAIGSSAFFQKEAITGVKLPNTLTVIGHGAFGFTGLTSVDIPYGVTKIEGSAFNGCENLKSVTIPDSVTQIDNWAFINCGLESVYIPDSVTYLGDSFAGCDNLTTAVIGSGKGSITVFDGAFKSCDVLSELVLSDSVVYIGQDAFGSCVSLTEVLIPDSVTEIAWGAFHDCTALEAVAINPDDSGIETTILSGAFQNCTSLTDVYLGEGVTLLEQNAFLNCPSLLEIQLPKSITEIGEHALGYLSHTSEDGYETTYTTVDGFTIYAFVNTVGVDYAVENDIPLGLLYYLFTDDNGKGTWTWAADFIYECAAYGLVSGYEDGTFRPDRQISRAEFVTMLYSAHKAAGGDMTTSGSHPFKDCTANWYQPYIIWAYESGIVSGTTATTFSPDAPITREQMAAILYKYLVTFWGAEPVPYDLSQFPDQGSISPYARPAIQFCVACGLMSGTADKNGTVTIAPKAPTTRAQAATVFYRTFLDTGEDVN